MSTFDKFYGIVLGVLIAVNFWAFFDIHNRLPIVLFMQAVVLVLRVFRRRRRPEIKEGK